MNTNSVVPTLRQAICTAQSDTPGPAFVEFPLDVLQTYEQAAKEAAFVQNANTEKKVPQRKFLID